MAVVKKIIGLMIVIGIILLLVNAKKILPSLNNLALGGGTNKTPFQIGTSYVEQIEKMAPQVNYGTGYTPATTGYGFFNSSSRAAGNNARATVAKSNGQIVISVENIQTNSNIPLYMWLTNTSTISGQTEYVDFGQIRNTLGVQSYVVNLNGGDIDLSVYKYLLLVDPTTNKLYGVATLTK